MFRGFHYELQYKRFLKTCGLFKTEKYRPRHLRDCIVLYHNYNPHMCRINSINFCFKNVLLCIAFLLYNLLKLQFNTHTEERINHKWIIATGTHLCNPYPDQEQHMFSKSEALLMHYPNDLKCGFESVLGKTLVPFKNQKEMWKCLKSAEISEETNWRTIPDELLYQIQLSKGK